MNSASFTTLCGTAVFIGEHHDLRGVGAGSGYRARPRRALSVRCRCRCPADAERHPDPPSDRSRLRCCACACECGGAVVASREHVRCIPCAGSCQPVTIAVGLSPLLLGKRSPTVIATHAYCMTWSYAGLVAAGCGQLAVAVGQDDSDRGLFQWRSQRCCPSAASSSSGEFRRSLIAC